jgi:kynurenine formamidase
MPDKRVRFDFEVDFANGGALRGQEFRLDIDGDDIDDDALAAYIIKDLRLLMVSSVRVFNKRILIEPHKRTTAGGETTKSRDSRIIDLSHAGTCIDIPVQSQGDSDDLSALALDEIVDIPAVVVRATGANARALEWTLFAAFAAQGAAVLVHTGWDRHWGTPHYLQDPPFLTQKAALYLRDRGARLVGIDAPNVDDSGGSRPVHTVLLEAGIPVVQHLTGLEWLTADSFTFSAPPPKIIGAGPFLVRAYATDVSRRAARAQPTE